MGRLDVAYNLEQLIISVQKLCELPQYNKDPVILARRIGMIISHYVFDHNCWWVGVSSGLKFDVVRNYTDKCFEAVPSKRLQAFIRFVNDDIDSLLVPASLKYFPLKRPDPSANYINIG